MTKYIPCTEVAKMIRADLRKRWPRMTFSVRSKNHSSIRVEWRDGPTDKSVREIVGKYAGTRYNLYEDIAENVSTTRDGEQVHYLSDHVFTERSYSPLFLKSIAGVVADEWSQPMPEIVTSKYDGSASIQSDKMGFIGKTGRTLDQLIMLRAQETGWNGHKNDASANDSPQAETPAKTAVSVGQKTIIEAAEVFEYALRSRPPMYGTCPPGFTVKSEEHTDATPYGTITYPRKLTEAELYQFEIWPVSANAYFFQVGERVIVNEVDPAEVVRHLPLGRYEVKYDSTQALDNVHRAVMQLESEVIAELVAERSAREVAQGIAPVQTFKNDKGYQFEVRLPDGKFVHSVDLDPNDGYDTRQDAESAAADLLRVEAEVPKPVKPEPPTGRDLTPAEVERVNRLFAPAPKRTTQEDTSYLVLPESAATPMSETEREQMILFYRLGFLHAHTYLTPDYLATLDEETKVSEGLAHLLSKVLNSGDWIMQVAALALRDQNYHSEADTIEAWFTQEG